MKDEEQIRQMVLRVIDSINAGLAEGQQIDKAPSAVLVGRGGSLDSLGFVDLAMQLQEAILDDYDLPVTVADEKVLESAEGPFRSVDTLVEHIAGLLENE